MKRSDFLPLKIAIFNFLDVATKINGLKQIKKMFNLFNVISMLKKRTVYTLRKYDNGFKKSRILYSYFQIFIFTKKLYSNQTNDFV